MHELGLRGLDAKSQVPLPVRYRGVTVECGYRLDVVVNDAVLLELKAVEQVLALHEAQILTYLKLSGYLVGLILNFNVPLMKRGIHRFVRNLHEI